MAIASQTELIHLAPTLARQLGYYEQEGVVISIADTSGGSKALEALLGGSADVVSAFYDHAIRMAAEGSGLL